jgi:hypothetical protein
MVRPLPFEARFRSQLRVTAVTTSMGRLDPHGQPTLNLLSRTERAVSSAEEHFLDMEGVRGSIPLPPTSKKPQ